MNVFDSVTSPLAFSYHCVFALFLTMPVGFNLTYRLSLKSVASKLSLFTDDPFSKLRVYHKDSTTSQSLKKVKPCSAGFAPEWVTKYKYPVLYLNNFFFPPLSEATLKTAELPALCCAVSSISQLFVHFAMFAFTCIYLQHRINKQRNMSSNSSHFS